MSHAKAHERPLEAPRSPLRVGDLLVDLDRHTVRREALVLDVPDRSFRLLAALIRHAPDTVSKDQLIAEVWDDAVVSDETLAQRVRLLRRTLGDDSQNPRYVASLRGRGYRLVPMPEAAPTVTAVQRLNALWIVAAALLVALALAWMLTRPNEPAPRADGASVLAVLPFKDMSEDGGQQYFADGMHEELLSTLASIDGLAVISRTSVERYRDDDASVPQIAMQLGADAVLEGSIRVDGDRLRVTVQFIDAATDEHLWAGNFDRQMSMQDVFGLQAEVAQQIAEALRLERGAAPAPDARLPTDSIEAYNNYLLGRYHTFRQTRQDLEDAVTFLQRAIAIDPQFAEAYAALGWAYSFLGSEYGPNLPREMYPKAKEAALRALALDSELSDARTLYADILTWYDWDFAAAEREYRRTLELDPLNVLGYALFLSTQERHEEAIALIERRLAASPNDPYVQVNAGWRYLNAGLPDRAVEAARAAQGHPDSTSLLGMSRLAQGDAKAAIKVFEAALESQGETPLNVANLAMAYYRDGRRTDGDALRRELEAFAEDNYVFPGLLAAVRFTAGDADRGFEFLDRAYEERTRDMIFLKVNGMLRGYRDDPRYLALLERVGF